MVEGEGEEEAKEEAGRGRGYTCTEHIHIMYNPRITNRYLPWSAAGYARQGTFTQSAGWC